MDKNKDGQVSEFEMKLWTNKFSRMLCDPFLEQTYKALAKESNDDCKEKYDVVLDSCNLSQQKKVLKEILRKMNYLRLNIVRDLPKHKIRVQYANEKFLNWGASKTPTIMTWEALQNLPKFQMPPKVNKMFRDQCYQKPVTIYELNEKLSALYKARVNASYEITTSECDFVDFLERVSKWIYDNYLIF